MNYKALTIMTLVLMLALVVPAMATDKWYESKYNPNVGSLYDRSQDPNTYSGSAEVIIRSHSNLMNPTMTLVNDAMPNATKDILVNEDGINYVEGLPAGEFTLTLHTFDLGNQVQHFTVATGQQEPTRVVFLGQAFSASGKHVPVINIIRAQYGIITLVSPEIPAYYTVVDVEQPRHGQHVYGNCEETHGSNYDFMIGNEKFVFDNHGDDFYTYHAEVPAVYSGTIVDVTSNVRTTVSAGYNTFLFNNAQNPGGIFDKTTTTLLSPVTDPAPGQVKNVVITYNVDGGIGKTINSQEYQIINLV